MTLEPGAAHASRVGTDHLQRLIGELCVGGDWACTHGDVSTLGHIAEHLIEYTHEPLHCELATLSEICRCDPDRAVAA